MKEITEFLENLEEKVCFIGADKNTGLGKVKIIEIQELTSESEENWIWKVLNKTDAEESNQERIYLIPKEMRLTNKEDPFVFPLVVRWWDEEKGSGEEVKYVGLVKFPGFS